MGNNKRSGAAALRWVALAAMQFVWLAPARADDAQRIQELENQLSRSMQKIEQLNRRVQQLEVQRPATAAAPAPTEDANARVDRLEQTVQTLSENAAKT